MLPTLSVDGDGVLLSSYHRRGRGIKVGDIVAFSHPMDTRHAAMKRVVGMPGDFVCTGAEVKGEAGMIQVCLDLRATRRRDSVAKLESRCLRAIAGF